MNSTTLGFAIVMATFAIAGPILWIRRRQIRKFVNKWAAENNFHVIKYEERTFSPFTFSLKKSRNQATVLAEIEDADGNKKTCWLIVGGYFSGLFTYGAECKWEE